MYLETEFGKLTFAKIFSVTEQLFWKFHKLIKDNLSKASTKVIGAYSEIYYFAWKKSNATMREVIEQHGLTSLICTAILLQRVGPSVETFQKVLFFLQSLQKHRTDLRFSRVVTQLYAPILWRQLTHQFAVIRCNSVEMLTKIYPLEKRGETYNVSTMFLIKQQDALLNAMEDQCPEVRFVATQGICICMKKCWYTFKENELIKCFKAFLNLIEDDAVEVRETLFHGFTLLLDKNESHSYFKDSVLMNKIKKTLMNEDEEDTVRCALLYFLLKVKKVDSKLEDIAKINYEKVVNLQDIATVLVQESEKIRYPIVDLIFDYFIGDTVLDENVAIMRFNEFYKINPIAFRNMILFSKRNLDFNNACKLMVILLQNVYCLVTKKEKLKDTDDMDNNIHVEKPESNNYSENIGDTNTSSVGNNDDNKQNKDSYICCILDCVNCLIVVHYDTFIKDNNRQQFTEIEDLCISCLIEILKLYKDDEVYITVMSLAALIPVSKITAHTSVPSIALSTLKHMPNVLKHADELTENLQDCLVYALSMWDQSYKIMKIVNIWFDSAFKTLDLHESKYKTLRSISVFETHSEICKPMTGITLMTSILTSTKSQDKLMDSGFNANYVHDMIKCLENVKRAIEKRMIFGDALNNLLSDEVLIELIHLYMRLNIIYHHNAIYQNDNEIIKHQMSIFDWIIEKLLTKDLQDKDHITKIFIVRTIKVINSIVYNTCSMKIGTRAYVNKFFTLCSAVIDNNLGHWILLHTIKTLASVIDLLNNLKHVNNIRNDITTLNNCVSNITSIISVIEDFKFNREEFKLVIGNPNLFCEELSDLILELYKLSKSDFHQIFLVFIETIMVITDTEIRKIKSIDLARHPVGMPYSASMLVRVILYNEQLMRYFSINIVKLFSSRIYQNDSVRLLSAIYFVYNITFSSEARKIIDFSPIIKLLYKILTRPEYTSISLYNIGYNPAEPNLDVSIFEEPPPNHLACIKLKGRNTLINIATKLRLTLCD